VLTVRRLSAGYGDAPVVHDVDLVVPPGHVAALLGPNGAGKTTVLRAVAGSLCPSGGRVEVDGDDLTGAAPHRLAAAGVCLVPEGRAVFRSLTVRQNLLLQVAGTGQVDAAVALERAVDAFPRLAERLDQPAGTLSGGEQQMLALARSHTTAPRYVLLDEVSMGLAPVVVDELFAFLGRLARSGAGLLIVEQYVDRALELADVVYLLDRGRVAFAGEPSELEGSDLFARYLGVDDEGPGAAARGRASWSPSRGGR
jgi:branched-chain amino acid transport system ATP-binding protein